MASDHKAGSQAKHLLQIWDFLLRNLKSRGPQAKGFCAKIITILFANVELHREKNKNKNKNKNKKKTKLAI